MNNYSNDQQSQKLYVLPYIIVLIVLRKISDINFTIAYQ